MKVVRKYELLIVVDNEDDAYKVRTAIEDLLEEYKRKGVIEDYVLAESDGALEEI